MNDLTQPPVPSATIVTFPASSARYGELAALSQQIKDVISAHAGTMPLATVLGVLRIVEHELIQEHSEDDHE